MTATAATTFEWTPAADDASPLAGYLRIIAKRATVLYKVDEFPADEGRAFQLLKSDGTPGTDRTEAAYAVFCGRGGVVCECKGYTRYRSCKHSDAVAELISTGQL